MKAKISKVNIEDLVKSFDDIPSVMSEMRRGRAGATATSTSSNTTSFSEGTIFFEL